MLIYGQGIKDYYYHHLWLFPRISSDSMFGMGRVGDVYGMDVCPCWSGLRSGHFHHAIDTMICPCRFLDRNVGWDGTPHVSEASHAGES